MSSSSDSAPSVLTSSRVLETYHWSLSTICDLRPHPCQCLSSAPSLGPESALFLPPLANGGFALTTAFAERRERSFSRSWSDPTPMKADTSHDSRDSRCPVAGWPISLTSSLRPRSLPRVPCSTARLLRFCSLSLSLPVYKRGVPGISYLLGGVN